MFSRLKTTCILLVLTLPVFGQHEQHSNVGKGGPAVLLSGMGTHRHAIRTRNSEAQKFFDQGINMLFGFNRHEAFRSFQRAAELDPEAVMPLWGMAMATGPHINMDIDGDVDVKVSCQAVEKARGLKASPSEKAYLEAAATRCPEYKPAEYTSAMRELMNRFPDDLDAATLFVESVMVPVRWAWWKADGTPAEGMAEAVQVLESVMRRNPNHPGANHFYIHAVEMSPSPERAIPSAQRLMGIVPAAGHLVHMPGHIWMILGDFDTVADTNERAVQVDREYFAKTGATASSYVGYYVHNLHFVAVARQMQGRREDALKSAQECAKEVMPMADAMPSMTDAFLAMPIYALVRFQRWDDMLAMPKPQDRFVATLAIWHYGRALAYKAKGQSDEAQKEQKAFEATRAQTPADWALLNNQARNILAIVSEVLSGRLASDAASAIPHFERAVELQSQLRYDEPPPFYYPVRESLGAALLKAGRTEEAEKIFREGIRLGPRNGRMIFGLMETMKRKGDAAAADSLRQEFEAAWRKADVTLRMEDL